MRDTIVYAVNIHFCKYCILGVKLSAQITMHLVCIRQIKFRFLNPIKSILPKIPSNCYHLASSQNRAIILQTTHKVETQLSLEIAPVIIPNRSNRHLRPLVFLEYPLFAPSCSLLFIWYIILAFITLNVTQTHKHFQSYCKFI